MVLVKNLKAPVRKKWLAKAARRLKNKHGHTVWEQRDRRQPRFVWWTPRVGRAARLLIADMQAHYGWKPAYGKKGFFTKALIARLRADAYPGAKGITISKPSWSWSGTRTRLTWTPTYFICHYSAGPATSTAADIHRIHLARGFLGLGYTWVIEDDGKIVQGRGPEYVGAHTQGWNNEWAVCLPGDNSAPPTDAQLASLAKLIAHANKLAGRKLIIKGHREMPGNATSCPGKYWPWKGVR